MVSISPVPKLEPGPVSYCQLDDGAVCAGPLKSSLNTVDQPGGGAGTAAGKAAARAVAAREAAAGVVAAATAGTAGAVSAMIDVTAAASAARRRLSRRDVTTAATRASRRPSRRNATTVTMSASRRPPRRGQSGAAWGALRACRSEPFIGRNLPRQNYKESFLFIDATISRGPGGVNTGICLAVVGYGRLASPCAAMDEGNGLRHSGEVRTRSEPARPRRPVRTEVPTCNSPVNVPLHRLQPVQRHIHGVSGTRHEGHERRMGRGIYKRRGTCGTGSMNAPSKHHGR